MPATADEIDEQAIQDAIQEAGRDIALALEENKEPPDTRLEHIAEAAQRIEFVRDTLDMHGSPCDPLTINCTWRETKMLPHGYPDAEELTRNLLRRLFAESGYPQGEPDEETVYKILHGDKDAVPRLPAAAPIAA